MTTSNNQQQELQLQNSEDASFLLPQQRMSFLVSTYAHAPRPHVSHRPLPAVSPIKASSIPAERAECARAALQPNVSLF